MTLLVSNSALFAFSDGNQKKPATQQYLDIETDVPIKRILVVIQLDLYGVVDLQALARCRLLNQQRHCVSKLNDLGVAASLLDKICTSLPTPINARRLFYGAICKPPCIHIYLHGAVSVVCHNPA